MISPRSTGREGEVARLLAAGPTETLVIAEVHVKHLLGKLDLRSRAQVAAWPANQSV